MRILNLLILIYLVWCGCHIIFFFSNGNSGLFGNLVVILKNIFNLKKLGLKKF